MNYNPAKYHRRSTRLKGYDYSKSGTSFVTICTYQRQCLFGEIVNREMQLNEFGEIASAPKILNLIFLRFLILAIDRKKIGRYR